MKCDETVKSWKTPVLSFRTWSGIQLFQYVLDIPWRAQAGVRRYDDYWTVDEIIKCDI